LTLKEVGVIFVKMKTMVLNVEIVIECGHVGHVTHVHCFPLNEAKVLSLIRL